MPKQTPTHRVLAGLNLKPKGAKATTPEDRYEPGDATFDASQYPASVVRMLIGCRVLEPLS